MLPLTPLHAVGPPEKFAAAFAQTATLRLKFASLEAVEVAANGDECDFAEGGADIDGALILNLNLPTFRLRVLSSISNLLPL